MGPRKKARKGAISHHQQNVPPAATNSTLYTSSYMIVQEPSPPPSSSQLSFSSLSSSEQSHRFPDATIPSRSLRHEPRARCVQTNTPKTPEGPVRQLEETVLQDKNRLHRKETTPMESGVGPRTSLQQMARTQQTTKLVGVLIRDESILPNCVEPDEYADDNNCMTAVGSVSRAAEDWRFQSWRSVKALASPSTKRTNRIAIPRKKWNNGAVPFGTALKNSPVPIMSTLVMSINAQKFLKSVIEAIGARRLTQVFHRRLVRNDELPDDISPLIFSPLFLKTFKRQIQKVNLATRDRDKPDNSESEWSDWEEDHDDEASSDEAFATRTIDADDALPSTEQKNDSEDVPELATGEKPEAPSTLVASQEPGTPMTWTKMNCKARREKIGCKVDAHGGSQNGPTLLSTIEDPTRRPVSVQVQPEVQDWDAEMEQAARREPETPFSSASHVRLFADFATPVASEAPDHETESITHFRNLLRNRPEKVNPSKAVNETRQHVTNLSSQGEDRTTTTTTTKKKKKKKTSIEHPGKVLSIFKNQGATPSTSLTKGGSASISTPALPVRETPAILRAENQRQETKLTKPLAPTRIPSRSAAQRKQNGSLASRFWVQAEISPLDFYNSSSSICNNTRASQPKYPERTCNGTKALGKKNKLAAGDNNNDNSNSNSVARGNSVPKQHHELSSRQNSPSDDELSLPSMEEIYESLLNTAQGCSSTENTTKQPATTTTTKTIAMAKATTTQTELEKPRPLLGQHLTARTRENNNSKKKRPLADDYTVEEEGTDASSSATASCAAASSPKKRMKKEEEEEGEEEEEEGESSSPRHNLALPLLRQQPRAKATLLPPT
ncbi:hypothetical protein EV127DRAFT_414344 [Xylaria flabelliformis]|nr:hypothetical protein EV127DRAFT_414344 [Xylaria flabelliformis]